jgi:hypothetical protein
LFLVCRDLFHSTDTLAVIHAIDAKAFVGQECHSMSQVSPAPEHPTFKALIAVGVAIILIGVEAKWHHHDSVWTGSLAGQRALIHRESIQDPSRPVVYRDSNQQSVSFSLKAGDDCLYLDGPDWMNRDAGDGETLVPVFCPARGAGWASLDFLKQNNR